MSEYIVSNCFYLHRERRPRTAIPSQSRPTSSPAHTSRSSRAATWGDYDMLTTEIIGTFSEGDKLNGGKYGEKITIIGKDKRGRPELLVYCSG